MTSLHITYKFEKGEKITNVVKKLGDNCLLICDNNGNELYNKYPKIEQRRIVTRSTSKAASIEKESNLIPKDKKTPKKEISELEMFFNKYRPRIEKYTTKSLLLTTNEKVDKQHYIFDVSDLKKPLYYNYSLKGWISSIINSKSLYKYYQLSDIKSFDDELSDLSDDGVLSGLYYSFYKNGILIKPNKNDSRFGTKYFYGGYWNDTLKGWIFNRSCENDLLDLGATIY